MEDKYLIYLKELKKTLNQIQLLIEDNNQNIKDCVSIINEINKSVNFKKQGRFKTLFFKIFGFKHRFM